MMKYLGRTLEGYYMYEVNFGHPTYLDINVRYGGSRIYDLCFTNWWKEKE